MDLNSKFSQSVVELQLLLYLELQILNPRNKKPLSYSSYFL